MNILHIETSTTVCSVAISFNEKIIFTKKDFQGLNHAALLSLFIEEGMSLLKKENIKLDAIAVSSGPGSYTGLRIGVSTAKGLCYGLEIPLIALDTLKILLQGALKQHADNHALFCPMIDARRMEVYDEILDAQGNTIRETSADIIDNESFSSFLNKSKVYFFGNGSDKCSSVITHQNAEYINNIYPLAENMVDLAIASFEKKEFADLAYFEPFYLKEFQATSPKNKVL